MKTAEVRKKEIIAFPCQWANQNDAKKLHIKCLLWIEPDQSEHSLDWLKSGLQELNHFFSLTQ
ncbi:MAG: hypothetical protein H7839_17915 [Magnetococcus sp. YQC-5]